MNEWDLSPPPPSGLGDHDVPIESERLAGRRVALLITGGIAAMKAPLIARALRRHGAEVVAFISDEGLRYVTEDTLEWSSTRPVVTRLTPAAEHLSDSAPFDAYLLAPATYNSINKFAYGIADGLITSTLASALGRQEEGKTKVLVAPTMHGSLHNRILTESLARLRDLNVRIIPPREDYGKHNIPSEDVLVAETCRAISNSPLRDVRVLVTGGPTPVPIDDVRRIVTRFRGRLGVLVTEELYARGADVTLIHGDGAYHPPPHLPFVVARTYDEYRSLVQETLAEGGHPFAIFSAAVADYQPEDTRPGKTPSGQSWDMRLVPTAKVIEEVRDRFPDLYSIIFKYQQDISHEELMTIARNRIKTGFPAIIANRGEEMGAGDEQVAYLVVRGSDEVRRISGKRAIARGIADHLEAVWTAQGDVSDSDDAADQPAAAAGRASDQSVKESEA